MKKLRHTSAQNARLGPQRLDTACAALAMPAPNPLAREAAADFMRRVASLDIEQCPRCHARWRLVQTMAADRAALQALPAHQRTPPAAPRGREASTMLRTTMLTPANSRRSSGQRTPAPELRLPTWNRFQSTPSVQHGRPEPTRTPTVGPPAGTSLHVGLLTKPA